ncbi:MAG: hypothetical protein NW217_15725 [Hyphomicrobiaceae bacterium]|nr:hypothetical protein [Hyphomicrobiaceae bacterium]
MKLSQACVLVGLGLLAGAPSSAMAGGDWPAGGSTKDYGTAVPVPAPAPVPVYQADWYFRADGGIGFGDDPESSERGLVYGQEDIASGQFGDGPFGLQPAWFNNDFETFVTLGVGVGYYWNDRFRTDLTAETRSQGKVKFDGTYTYDTPTDPQSGEFQRVEGVVRDETTVHGGVFLFNAYYDFKRDAQQTFVPYVGGGVGFAWTELKRNHWTDQFRQDCDEVNGCDADSERQTDAVNVQDKTHSVTFAAAATAGFSYQFSEAILLDMNYRFLYLGGTDAGFQVTGTTFGGATGVTISDAYEHQLRAGLRFNVN